MPCNILLLYGIPLLNWYHRHQQQNSHSCSYYIISKYILEASSIHVGHFVLILGRVPCYPLFQLKFIVVPYLNLIFSCIRSNQKLSVWIVQRISSDMWTKYWFYTFSLTDIPQMYNTIPTSRNDRVVINKFDRKYAVRMSPVVPFSTSQIYTHTFCIWLSSCLL